MVQITFNTQIGTDLTNKIIIIGMIINLGETIKIGIHNGVIMGIQIEIQLHNRPGTLVQTELGGSEKVAMRRNWSIEEGYFVCTKVNNIQVTFLIDTGSNISILSEDLVNRFPPDFHEEIQPTKTKLLSVTGEISPFLGKTTVTVEIGSQNVQQNVLIASIENECILGMDFLTTHHCDLMLSQQCMKLNGEKIRCFPNSREAQPTCCRVAISEYVEIPPETEVVVQGFVT